ncbi:MAG: winged helix-turn-helix domain-containing protein [Dehalococcoidia bacterium]
MVFTIAILSNQEALLNAAAAALMPSDYRLSTMAHGEASVEQLIENQPNILIFDHGDGSHVAEWRILGQERGFHEHTGLLALIQPDQARLLEELPTADDFVLWPTSSVELLLRIRAILRKRTRVDSENILRRGALVIDLANYKVALDSRSIELTYKEYELLRFLASNSDKVYTREALLNRVWGYDYYGGARTVDVHIRRLRSKIEIHGHSFIETIRNVGYRFHEG